MSTEPVRPSTPVPVVQLSYPAAVAELEAIVDALDDGVVDVDTLSDRFQRAIDLVEELDRRIVGARSKVQELAPRLERLDEAPRPEA